MQDTCTLGAFLWDEGVCKTRVHLELSSGMREHARHVYTWSLPLACILPHPRGKLQVYTCLTYSLIPEESSKCTRVLHTPSSQRKAPSVHVSYILPHPRGKLQVYTCLPYSLIPEESSKCTRVFREYVRHVYTWSFHLG
jgi:hypothetical protein